MPGCSAVDAQSAATACGCNYDWAKPDGYCSYHSWQDTGGGCESPAPPSPAAPPSPPLQQQVHVLRAAWHWPLKLPARAAAAASAAPAAAAAAAGADCTDPTFTCTQAAASPPPQAAPQAAGRPSPPGGSYRCTQRESPAAPQCAAMMCSCTQERPACRGRPGLAWLQRCGRAVCRHRMWMQLRLGQAGRVLQLPQLAGHRGRLRVARPSQPCSAPISTTPAAGACAASSMALAAEAACTCCCCCFCCSCCCCCCCWR